jgi:hypothetical protein
MFMNCLRIDAIAVTMSAVADYNQMWFGAFDGI